MRTHPLTPPAAAPSAAVGTPATGYPGERWANAPTIEPSQAEKDLTGVVIWPNIKHEDIPRFLEKQKNYGRALSAGITEAGRAIRSGGISNLEALWVHARQTRGSAQVPPFDFQFFSPRDTTKAHDFFSTPITGRYLTYLQSRLTAHPRFEVSDVFGGKHILDIKGTLPDGDIQLTMFISADRNNDPKHRDPGPIWAQFSPNSDLPPEVQLFQGQLFNPSISHLGSTRIPAVMAHAETLYRAALNAPDETTFREKSASLYWWLAHACPDKRGSAAKTEICYRAMYAARGLACPLWARGISPDLEVMLRTEDEWLRDYSSLTQSTEALLDELAPTTPDTLADLMQRL